MVLPYGVSHEHTMQGILCVRGSYISVIGGFFIFDTRSFLRVKNCGHSIIRVIRGLFCLYAPAMKPSEGTTYPVYGRRKPSHGLSRYP
jgi:hypothetical protein